MSESNVIVISSDEDLDSVQVPKENELLNNINTEKTSNEEIINNDCNEICSIKQTNSSVNRTSEETEKENFNIQSDKSVSEPIKNKNITDNIEVIENNLYNKESGPFKKFMSAVLAAEEEEENKKKVFEKLNKYYRLADPNYIRSVEFTEILEKSTEKIKSNSVYLYFELKEVKDCLISNKVKIECKQQNAKDEEVSSSSETVTEKTFEESSSVSEDQKSDETVSKLTFLLKKIAKKIKNLEKMEVDFSDEENSTYFKMQRYRERYCQIYEKLCTLTNQPRIGVSQKINFTDTDNLELNREIEKWLNKTNQFPDFSDMNKVMNELNQSLNLKLNQEQTKMKAQQIFEKIGNMLQRRRHFDLWDSLSTFLDTDIDPSVKNPKLDSLLKRNFKMGVKKEKELLAYYVEKQEREKLQPREVPDEEANCSPIESGDEDEKEIENFENMLNSKPLSDVDDEDDEGEGTEGAEETEGTEGTEDTEEVDIDSIKSIEGNTASKITEDDETMKDAECKNDEEVKSTDGSVCLSDSLSVEEVSGRRDTSPEIKVDSHDSQNSSSSNDGCVQIIEPVDSGKNETVVGTNSATMSASDENLIAVVASKEYTETNPIFSRSKTLIKRKNETLNENENDSDEENENVNVHPLKIFSEGKGKRQEGKSFKKTKLIIMSDSESDCEIIDVVPDKKATSRNPRPLLRKVYHINYAFIKSNANYHAILSDNIFAKGHYFSPKYKKSALPLSDLTNIKSITNKFARYRENKMKKKFKNGAHKPRFFNAINSQPLRETNMRNNFVPISLGNNSITCALNHETNSENMKSQKGAGQTNDNNNHQQGSSDESARSPTNGSSGGGSGQDDGDDGNKKPLDRVNPTEGEEQEEDEDNDNDEDEESPDNKQPKTSEASNTAPRFQFTGALAYSNEPNYSSPMKFNLPLTEKTTQRPKRNAGKQLQKTSGAAEPKETGIFVPTIPVRLPRTRTAATRKRKVEPSVEVQKKYQQALLNTSAIKVTKVPAQPVKQEINKVVPTATATLSTINDLVVQVPKKKISTSVKVPQSDEEIVKNFLERSNPSISITTPKKRNLVQKEPSPSVLQAIETLSRLKGISTTIVKGSSKNNTDEDVTVISESLNTRVNQISKLQKTPKPCTVTTAPAETFSPKIVTVQGNVAGFDSIPNEGTIIEQPTFYPIFIPSPEFENALPPEEPTFSGTALNYEENFTPPQETIPIPRFRNVRSRSRRTPKNKTKSVEYVILD